jgi:hypothetical protein
MKTRIFSQFGGKMADLSLEEAVAYFKLALILEMGSHPKKKTARRGNGLRGFYFGTA